MQIIFPVETASPNNISPQANAPSAPIPVHTAHAVPSGSDFTAAPNKPTLATRAATVPGVIQGRVKPSGNFRPITQAIS